MNECPECEGTNLNEDKTVCFDCQAADYLEVNQNEMPDNEVRLNFGKVE